MKIDIYTHVVPEKYKKALGKVAPHLEAATDGIPTLSNMEKRFAILDRYGEMKQVATLTMTASVVLRDPAYAVDFARRANDTMAELVAAHPDRFIAGTASVPALDIDSALEELERAVEQLGLKGLHLFTPVGGKPLDLENQGPLFEKMAHYDLPIWIHPMKPIDRTSYKSFYLDHVFGWPYESVAAMTSLVLDGLFERFPRIKIIVHHCGASVPFFQARITESYESSGAIFNMKHERELQNPLVDNYRMFYTDTALSGGTEGLTCGHTFFGPEHLLFGTDMPYDAEFGDRILRETIASVERMAINDREKEMIYSGNAKKVLGL